MGLILPTGYIKADMGSEVASDGPYPPRRVRNSQSCLYSWRIIPATM